MNEYFSDRENSPRARTDQMISPVVWKGLVGTVQALVNSGAFGLRFPERCPDGQAVCGSDSGGLATSVIAECLDFENNWACSLAGRSGVGA